MEIGDALVQIADKLGATGEHLVKVFSEAQVGMAIIDLVTTVIWFILMVIVIYIAYKFAMKKGQEEVEKYYNSDKRYVLDGEGFATILFITFVSAMFLFAILAVLGNNVAHIMYPEYFGVKDLLETLAKTVK